MDFDVSFKSLFQFLFSKDGKETVIELQKWTSEILHCQKVRARNICFTERRCHALEFREFQPAQLSLSIFH